MPFLVKILLYVNASGEVPLLLLALALSFEAELLIALPLSDPNSLGLNLELDAVIDRGGGGDPKVELLMR
jgi:hypothetical protein